MRQSTPFDVVPDAAGRSRLQIVREPPVEIALLIGEMAYQLRSSLDHLFFDLVAANHAGGILPKNWEGRCQFPILLKAPNAEGSQLSVGTCRGHKRMSAKKRDTFLRAEFDHLYKHIERFENRRADHSEKSLVSLLGADWEARVKDLKAIGFLKYNARTRTYSVPFIYRHCLNIRQGKES